MTVPEEWEERLLGLELRVERLTEENAELREKAEKWDEANRINVKIGGGKPISCVDMANKIEAIKKVVKKWDGYYPSPLAMGDIRKILAESRRSEGTAECL